MQSEHPIQGTFIPPYIIQHIHERGSSAQIAKIKQSMEATSQMSGLRESLASSTVVTEDSATEKKRLIYDAQNRPDLPGSLVRSEGDPPTGDPAADETYDGIGATYDLFKDIYDRQSIDNRGMQIVGVVHYLQGYHNLFWNGERLVLGDGDEDLPDDERLFNRMTISVDAIAHELTHGVIQYQANFIYRDQSGSLHESFADVFGALVKQRMLNQRAEEADWLMGEGIFTSNVNGKAIRSMADPGSAYDDPIVGKDPQPGHMKKYISTTADNVGVFINCGIPNKAFYVAAIEMGGFAWERAGHIWYQTLVNKLSSNSDFTAAASMTVETAGEIYGEGSEEQKAVITGWSEVGLTPPRKRTKNKADKKEEPAKAAKIKKSDTDKIPFHRDQVEEVDRLNREPIAISIARLLNNEVFAKDKIIDHSFMIHLQGAWGDGKSTFLKLLKKNLKQGNNKWAVVEFNAWRHQHVDPPWWSFLEQVYKDTCKELYWIDRIWFRFMEGVRRILRYNTLPMVISLLFTLFFAYLIFHYRDFFYQFFDTPTAIISESVSSDSVALAIDSTQLRTTANDPTGISVEYVEAARGVPMEKYLKIIAAFGGVIGLFYSLSRFLSYPIFLNSPARAKSFIQHANDPMSTIRSHFNGLNKNLRWRNYLLAVFIDDIDRCDEEFTVRLLEGIQTLFKNQPVLYVVAGDD